MSIDTNPTLFPDGTKLPDSLYMIAALNPKVKIEDATLEDYFILHDDPDNMKYMFIENVEASHDGERAFEISQRVLGIRIYDGQSLQAFLTKYLFADNVEEDLIQGQVPEKLAEDFHAFTTKADAYQKRLSLLMDQKQYQESLLVGAQEYAPTLNLIEIDLVILLAEFAQRVIVPNLSPDEPTNTEESKGDVNETEER